MSKPKQTKSSDSKRTSEGKETLDEERHRVAKGYLRILDYVEDVDPELSTAINNCCANFLFNPSGKTGLTFLMPVRGGAFRKKLLKLSLGDSEDRACASDMISCLVIPDYIASVDDFKGKYDDIPNSLGRILEIDLMKSGGNYITLKSGAVVKYDTRFRDASKKGNLHVFIVDGEVALDTPEAKFRYTRTSRTSRRKNTQKEEESVSKKAKEEEKNFRVARQLRVKIAVETEALFKLNYKNGARVAGEVVLENGKKDYRYAIKNVYLERVLSLVNYVLDYCSEETIQHVFFGKMLPLISYENIDFYLFIEPGNANGRYLIPTEIIERWYKSSPSFSMSKTLKRLDKYVKEYNSRLNKSFEKVTDAVDDIRDGVLKSLRCSPKEIAEIIFKQYEYLIKNNTIKGREDTIGNVFPEPLLRHYREFPHKKIMEDELRFTVHCMFEDLDKSSFNVDSDLDDIINKIISRTKDYSSKNSIRLLSPDALEGFIQPQEKVNDMLRFLNSSYFMYLPMSEANLETFRDRYTALNSPSFMGDGIWIPRSFSKAKFQCNRELDPETHKGEKKQRTHTAIEVLKEIGKDDPELIEQLRTFGGFSKKKSNERSSSETN